MTAGLSTLPRTALMASYKLGERTSRDHLCAVDGKTRATGRGDALVDAIERRLARVGPLRALRRAAGELAGVRRCGG